MCCSCISLDVIIHLPSALCIVRLSEHHCALETGYRKSALDAARLLTPVSTHRSPHRLAKWMNKIYCKHVIWYIYASDAPKGSVVYSCLQDGFSSSATIVASRRRANKMVIATRKSSCRYLDWRRMASTIMICPQYKCDSHCPGSSASTVFGR